MGTGTSDFPETAAEHLDTCARTYYRAVLQYFRRQTTEAATIDDLVAFIRDKDQPDANETQVAIRLHHSTLPRLADDGWIDYDARSNTARYRGHPSATQ